MTTTRDKACPDPATDFEGYLNYSEKLMQQGVTGIEFARRLGVKAFGVGEKVLYTANAPRKARK